MPMFLDYKSGLDTFHITRTRFSHMYLHDHVHTTQREQARLERSRDTRPNSALETRCYNITIVQKYITTTTTAITITSSRIIVTISSIIVTIISSIIIITFTIIIIVFSSILLLLILVLSTNLAAPDLSYAPEHASRS